MKTKFPHYKPSKQERQLVQNFEQYSNFDLMNPEQVTDIHSFNECMLDNIQWFRDNVREVMDRQQDTLEAYYDDAISRSGKITRLLK